VGARFHELTGRARTRHRGHPIPLQFSGRWLLPDNFRAEEQVTPTSAVGGDAEQSVSSQRMKRFR
jgi:hypothetical protein